jgi:hypothetical protein
MAVDTLSLPRIAWGGFWGGCVMQKFNSQQIYTKRNIVTLNPERASDVCNNSGSSYCTSRGH